MYRYSVDNAVTYTSEDFVLFRESPFACWMERLSLENPDHGIPADVGSLPPRDSIEPQDDMADTLRTEGKDVSLIEWDLEEAERRRATLEAMRKGADFIVNGQLALGPLSGAANLLVRTSGFSELGDYLYLPCSTQGRACQHIEFRLCFLADLLHSLQGQLPPQMLLIRGGDDLVPLQTESFIYHYRAVKQRFMEAMRSFRKHRMPDPAESAHFGRWSDCAHEVLKQRLLREEQVSEEITDEDYQEPMRRAAGDTAGGDTSLNLESRRASGPERDTAVAASATSARTITAMEHGNSSGFTLAEQAHMLTPGAYKPGPGVFRLGRPKTAKTGKSQTVGAARAERDDTAQSRDAQANTAKQAEPVKPALRTGVETRPQYNRRASDIALQNLEFIGSSPRIPGMAPYTAPTPETTPPPETEAGFDTGPRTVQPHAISTAPAPSLRDPRSRGTNRENGLEAQVPGVALGSDSVWDFSLEGNTKLHDESLAHQPRRREEPLSEPVPPPPVAHSAIDMDATHVPSPPPVLSTSDAVLPAELGIDDEEVEHGFGQAAGEHRASERRLSDRFFSDRAVSGKSPDEDNFSNSLITSDDYHD